MVDVLELSGDLKNVQFRDDSCLVALCGAEFSLLLTNIEKTLLGSIKKAHIFADL